MAERSEDNVSHFEVLVTRIDAPTRSSPTEYVSLSNKRCFSLISFYCVRTTGGHFQAWSSLSFFLPHWIPYLDDSTLLYILTNLSTSLCDTLLHIPIIDGPFLLTILLYIKANNYRPSYNLHTTPTQPPIPRHDTTIIGVAAMTPLTPIQWANLTPFSPSTSTQ